jgi:hypothetical protein
MKKLISHLWYIGGVKKFDTETGKVSRAFFANRNETDFGAAWKQNGKWFVFHCDDQSLILQHENKIWRVNSENNVSIKGDQIREFEIFKNEEKVFSINYKPKGLLQQLIDPTYDGIDAESDDFFLYVTNMWEYWAKRPYSEFSQNSSGYKNV